MAKSKEPISDTIQVFETPYVDDSKSKLDAAYSERNKLVALLSKLFPSVLQRHDPTNADWEDDWRWIVFIILPTGQCTWHIHDSELPLFAHLPKSDNPFSNLYEWDLHTTEEKYARVAAVSPNFRDGF